VNYEQPLHRDADHQHRLGQAGVGVLGQASLGMLAILIEVQSEFVFARQQPANEYACSRARATMTLNNQKGR
jgi:hypothetical protein